MTSVCSPRVAAHAMLLLAGAGSSLAAQVNTQRAAVVPAFTAVAAPIAAELSGQRAFETVRFVSQFFRLPGNRGFDASIDTVVRLLQRAGYVDEASAPPSTRFTYRIVSRALPQMPWSPLAASVALVNEGKPLQQLATNLNMLAPNSHSTSPAGVTALLIDVGAGADSDFAKVDVAGKIVIANTGLSQLVTRAAARGALGAMAGQRLAGFNDQAKNVEAIQYDGRGIARDTVRKTWGIYLSAASMQRVREAMAKGPTFVNVMTSAAFDDRAERSIVAEIRGSSAPSERIVYSAHVQESGANDNASGVGALAEMARAAASLVKNGRFNPGRTMTFLWGNEISWTQRYLAEDTVRRAGVKWGMSLDMVGENTALTKGTFLIEKMKDPSAVWVRGEDQHSEWGATAVKAADIVPYWFNDFTRQRCLAQAGKTNWVVKSNPYEGGSDHTPFLTAKIPAVLFWHFTDQFYHTDRDVIAMVSPTTLQNVSNCALATGFILAAGTRDYTLAALKELTEVAEYELRTQAELSRLAITSGGDRGKEATILTAWRDYYLGAIEKITDLHIGPIDLSIPISASQQRVRDAAMKGFAIVR